MEKLVGGKLRSIGVSNFSIENLEKLSTTAKIPPAVNQARLTFDQDSRKCINFTRFFFI
jgi:diketogulonate reductase-like aldo/keto reductase